MADSEKIYLLESQEKHAPHTGKRGGFQEEEENNSVQDLHAKEGAVDSVNVVYNPPLGDVGNAFKKWALPFLLVLLLCLTAASSALKNIDRLDSKIGSGLDSLYAGIEEKQLQSKQERTSNEEISVLKSELNQTKALLMYERGQVASLKKAIATLQDFNRCEGLLVSKGESIGSLKSELNETKALLVAKDEKSSLQDKAMDSLLENAEESRLKIVRYKALSDEKEETIGRLETELNNSRSDLRIEREVVATLSRSIDSMQVQVNETSKKSDYLIDLVKSDLRTSYKASFADHEELMSAVDDYMSDNSPTSAVALKYGPIGIWDVSRVTSFKNLFDHSRNGNAAEFNEDLSGWDVSKGTDFLDMFMGASKFTSDLSTWNMLSAKRTQSMFYKAKSFNSDLSKWDVSKVTRMPWMFYDAASFHSDIRNWDVSQVTNVAYMFGPNLQRFRDQTSSSWDLTKAGGTKDKMFDHV